MSLARSEAIKRNQRVAICPSDDGEQCSGNQYENGWIVFVDGNSNNSREVNTEELIWVQSQVSDLRINLDVDSDIRQKN